MYSYMLYSRAANIHVAHAVMSGRRSCLGQLLAQQEIYLFLAALIQNFVIKPPEGADEVVYEENVGLTVTPVHYTVRLLPRSYE